MNAPSGSGGLAVPDFVIAGAARCGTTALNTALSGHPGVRMSATKEPNHFLFRPGPNGPEPLIGPDRALLVKSVSDPVAYAALFPGADGLPTGDASPLYLYTRGTPELLAEVRPGARAVVVLRDPAERAFSHFLYTYVGSPARVVEEFKAAVAVEWDRGYEPYQRGTHVLRLGRYAEQLRHWEAALGRERLLVLDFADLAADFADTLRRILGFVGATDRGEPIARPDANEGGIPGSLPARAIERSMRAVQPYVKAALPARGVEMLARLRRRQRALVATGRPTLPEDLRHMLLQDYYAEDLAELGERWGVHPAADRT